MLATGLILGAIAGIVITLNLCRANMIVDGKLREMRREDANGTYAIRGSGQGSDSR